jgi:hypothetical protein
MAYRQFIESYLDLALYFKNQQMLRFEECCHGDGSQQERTVLVRFRR